MVDIIYITRKIEIMRRGESKVMPIKCMLVNKTSKDGNPYQCIEIYITDNVKKVVFLTQAERELLLLQKKG